MRKPDVSFAALDRLLVRVFGSRGGFSYERTPLGVSTQVYKLRRGSEIFYVRIGEEAEDSFAPEAEVHSRLLAIGARVPTVIHYEPYDEALDRSVMVTTEVPGGPADAATQPTDVEQIYRAAGHDLALVHSLPVQGFGWVLRDHGAPGWPIRGEFPGYRAFVDPSTAVAALVGYGFSLDEAEHIEKLLEEAISLGPAGLVGSLVHGDFDTTHLFTHAGRYSGMIDFGEIRGADYTFDFATLQLHTDKESRARAYLYVEKGYANVRPLPDDHARRLYLGCVVNTVDRLRGSFNRDGPASIHRRFNRWLAQRLLQLIGSGGLGSLAP